MPVFFSFWPSSIIISLHVIHQAPIRTIADHWQNSSVCPPSEMLCIWLFWNLKTLFSILWLTDTFCIVFCDLQTHFLFCDLQTHLDDWKSGYVAKYLWVMILCTVDSVWAEKYNFLNYIKVFYCPLPLWVTSALPLWPHPTKNFILPYIPCLDLVRIQSNHPWHGKGVCPVQLVVQGQGHVLNPHYHGAHHQ